MLFFLLYSMFGESFQLVLGVMIWAPIPSARLLYVQ